VTHGRRAVEDGDSNPQSAILVVESPSAAAQEVEAALVGHGYRVVARVTSAAAAIDAAGRERPDLAVVDVRLAVATDGIELAGELRRRHAVPVVFLSAESDRRTVDRLKPTMPFGFVRRPIDAADLRVAVDLALHRAAAESALRRAQAAREARIHELESRNALLEGRLREIAGLVSEGSAEAGAVDPGLERRLRGLSRREIEVVRCLSEGRRVAAISRDLDLSVHTVRNHLRAIFRKLLVHSQEELLDIVRALPPGALTGHR